MKDIEDYIKKNKTDFDVDGPSDQLWGRIESALDQQKVKRTWKFPFWLGIAASIMLIAGIFCFYKFYERSNQGQVAVINPGYTKSEMKFASLIEEKKDSLLIYAKDNPDLDRKFNEDLQALDKDYMQLKKELQDSPDQKVVVRAMAQNLETQLQIVSQQLSVISQVNNYRRENQL